MTQDRLAIAVVGCGRVSRTAHFDNLQAHPRYELRAVCDIDRTRAEETAAQYGVKGYTDLPELLDSETLDVVSICAPNGLHPRLALQVAERGVHVVCEKPLGMSVAEADRLIERCDEKGVQLFTVLQNRFNTTNQLLKRAVDKGRFGSIFGINVTMRWRRGMPYYLEDGGWRARRDLAGGCFTNQAIHYVDMLQWLVGAAPETAYAKMGTAVHPVEVETHGAGIIRFKNGVIGTLDLTVLAYPDDTEGSITVLGEHGTVKIGGKSMNKVLEWTFAEPDADDAEIQKADSEPPTVYGFGHAELYDRVARRLLDGDRQIEVPDGREGRKSVELLEALYRSDALSSEVRLPLESGR